MSIVVVVDFDAVLIRKSIHVPAAIDGTMVEGARW